MHIYRSKAPLRLGLGGGSSDLTDFVLLFGGNVLNATINKYVYATLVPTSDGKISIVSQDYQSSLVYDSKTKIPYDGNLDLVCAVVNRVKEFANVEDFSCELFVRSDAPPGAGLGTSSAVVVAVLGVFLEALNIKMNEYDIAKMAWKIEREDMNMSGGYQDQYASVFGGINFMEFHRDLSVIVNPMRVSKQVINELQHNILLCFTGMLHDSEDIIESHATLNKDIIRCTTHIRDIALQMKDSLLKGELDDFALLMLQEWQYKKQLSNKISNNKLESLENTALENGAIGLKVTGAGGGGMLIIYSDWRRKKELAEKMTSLGCQIWDFTITKTGLESWRV